MDDTTFDRLLNIQSYNEAALKDLVKRLTEEERELSRKRRLLHAEIDIVRAELVRRLRDKHAAGENVVSEGDLSELSAILSGQGPQGEIPDSGPTRGTADLGTSGGEASPEVGRPDAGHAVRDRFHDLSANVRDERLIRYIAKQVSQGRKLDDIMSDQYVRSHANEVKRAELMQSPHVIRALEEAIKSEFAKYGIEAPGADRSQHRDKPEAD